MKQSFLSWICLCWGAGGLHTDYVPYTELPQVLVVRLCFASFIESVVVVFVWFFKTVSLWRPGCLRTQEIVPSLSFRSRTIKGVCHHLLRMVVPESKCSGLVRWLSRGRHVQPSQPPESMLWSSHNRTNSSKLSCDLHIHKIN